MSRDHRQRRVFHLADPWANEVYRLTQQFPNEERFGLQSPIRRATVSTAANFVEGCARTTTKDYRHFVAIALGSASEARSLVELSTRFGFSKPEQFAELDRQAEVLIRGRQSLHSSLKAAGRPQPEARSP